MAVQTLNGTAYAISYLHGKLEHRFTPAYDTSSLRGSFVVNHGATLDRVYASNWAHGSVRDVHRLTKTDAVSNYAHGTIRVTRRIAKTDAQTNWLHGSIRTPVVHGLSRAINAIYSSCVLTPTVVSYSTPEDRYAQLGYRPLNSLLVYAASALTPSDIAGIPDLGSFLVSPSAYPTNASTFWAAGARPNYVGTVSSGSYFFRPPLDSEIVWQVTLSASGSAAPVQNLIYRDGAWLPFTTYAEKGIASQLQYVSAQLDPLGAYEYFGQLLGNVMAELGQDNVDLSTMSDPDQTPARYLPAMADVMGVDITDPGIQTPEQRRRIKAAIPLHQAKGTVASANAAISEAGFVGYLQEVEVNPTNASNWYSPATAPPNVVALLSSLGMLGCINPNSGQKGTDHILQDHGAGPNVDPTTYFPSTRLVAHVNAANGLPLFSAPVEAINRLYRYLRQYCLPACADIRYFATDVNLSDGGAGTTGGGTSGMGGNIGNTVTYTTSGSTGTLYAAYKGQSVNFLTNIDGPIDSYICLGIGNAWPAVDFGETPAPVWMTSPASPSSDGLAWRATNGGGQGDTWLFRGDQYLVWPVEALQEDVAAYIVANGLNNSTSWVMIFDNVAYGTNPSAFYCCTGFSAPSLNASDWQAMGGFGMADGYHATPALSFMEATNTP